MSVANIHRNPQTKTPNFQPISDSCAMSDACHDRHRCVGVGAIMPKFPVYFLVNGDFGLETGPIRTVAALQK